MVCSQDWWFLSSATLSQTEEVVRTMPRKVRCKAAFENGYVLRLAWPAAEWETGPQPKMARDGR